MVLLQQFVNLCSKLTLPYDGDLQLVQVNLKRYTMHDDGEMDLCLATPLENSGHIEVTIPYRRK